MKNLRLSEQKGIAQIFLLAGMLMVVVALPLATKLVQQNQENRSNAAVKDDSGCTSKGGTCKYTTASCNGSFKSGLCTGPSNRKCCVPGGSGSVKNDDGCTDIGGTCKTGSCTNGNFKPGLCTGSSSRKCCVPSSVTIGACGSATKGSYDSKPTKDLCSKGTVTWLDEAGYGGDYNWKCMGSKSGSTSDDVSCAAAVKAGTVTKGVCGSADGGTYSSKPTTGICSRGSSSWKDETGSSGYYKWDCMGSNGSSTSDDVSCKAKKSGAPTPSSSVKKCNSDTDCSSNQYCATQQGVKQCKSKKANNIACD
nr:hypothetical protein [Candidatus Shapirobacteria bacterium]